MKKYLTFFTQSLVACTFCFISLGQSPVLAQTQIDRDGVLPSQMHGTRSLSMASATIADVYGRPDMGINAALPGLFNDPSFIQINSNHNWNNNLMQHQLMMPTLSLGRHHLTTRFGLLHQGFEHLPFTKSETPTVPDMILYRGEIAYAIAISNHFSLGTLQSFSYTTTDDDTQQSYVADLGLVYAPDGPVSYGMVFRGLGHESTYETDEIEGTILDRSMARQALEVGATLRYPIESETYLSISFANEKRFGEDGLWYKGGVEIVPHPIIAIRGGTMVNFDRSFFVPRVGLGLNARVIQLNYMMAPKAMVGEQFHQIGLTIQF